MGCVYTAAKYTGSSSPTDSAGRQFKLNCLTYYNGTKHSVGVKCFYTPSRTPVLVPHPVLRPPIGYTDSAYNKKLPSAQLANIRRSDVWDYISNIIFLK